MCSPRSASPARQGGSIICPFPDHADKHPSWRWDGGKRRWFCTCGDGSGSVYDAVMRMKGFDFVEAVCWVKEDFLGGNVEPLKTSPKQRREQAAADRAEAAANLAAGQGELARYLQKAWACSSARAQAHPYLTAKGIQPHGILWDGYELLISMQDSRGDVRNMQRIFLKDVEPGPKYTFTKKFIIGLPTAGLFHFMGSLPAERLAFVEGFATGASVHEATGLPVVICFTADNLAPVAREFRKTFPNLPFLFAADDDFRHVPNKGIEAARAAARACGSNVEVISPNFAAERGERDTDFNDLAARLGLEEVRRQLLGIAPGAPGLPPADTWPADERRA